MYKPAAPAKPAAKAEPFFRTMTAQEYKHFSEAVATAPKPQPQAAVNTVRAVTEQQVLPIREEIRIPTAAPKTVSAPEPPAAPALPPEPEQQQLPMPQEIPWHLVGELFNTYLLVEQGEEAFLIDKHAAHERILFDKLKANQETISSQMLLKPVPCNLSADAAAVLLENKALLEELGFEIDPFGDNTVLLRQIPMDLSPDEALQTAESLAADLLSGRREKKENLRDELLHTIACKAAIKAGWHTDQRELLVLAKEVMAREDLKYCPHGRPICITLSKKQLEKQFKRT
jgi:DNA mismatch repair protein MutL